MAQNPIVTITMEDGSVMKAELYPEIAPNTVNNFLSLVNKGFYDGLIFHRVIRGFMIQGGCPDGTGMGGPGYDIKGEFDHERLQESAEAHTPAFFPWQEPCIRTPQAPSSSSCIRLLRIWMASMQHFGKVTEGLDVVDAIANVPTNFQDRPLAPQKIQSMTAETFGVEYPEPEKC